MGDNCPKGCKHDNFHYCRESGTHCDKHCVCKCNLCKEDVAKMAAEEKQKEAASDKKE